MKAADNTGYLLWQASAAWQRRIAAALRPHELTQAQFLLLSGILRLSTKEKSVSQVMLARHAKVDIMTVSQVLRALEARKYIRRRSHPDDSRANTLHLTETGKKLVLRAFPHVDKVDAEFFDAIKDHLPKFHALLRTLLA